MQRKKVLLLTDSLSLPRESKEEKVLYDQTYISLLKNANPLIDFIHVGIGGATIKRLCELLKYYVHSEPDFIILHCGIVDCAPRALSEFEIALLDKLRVTSLIRPLTKKLRKFRNLTYVNSEEFLFTLRNMIHIFDVKPFISIGIIPAVADYENIVPGISKNIVLYNQILKNNTRFICNNDFPVEGLMDDFHHINVIGHMFLFNKLNKVLNEI